MKPRGPTADDVILMKNDNAPRIFAEVATKLSRWSSRYPWLRQIVRLAIVVVPLTFLFWGLTTNWQDLQSYDWQFNSIRGGLAVCCLTLAFGLRPLASQQALLGLGYSIGYRAVYAGHFTAQLAKYLPGGVWVVPGRVIVFRKYGVNVISSSVGTIVELLMLLVSGVVVFLPYLLSVGTGPLSQLWTLGLLLIPATLIGLHPGIFNHVLRWSLALVGCKDVTIKLTIQQLASMLLTKCFFWRLKEKYVVRDFHPLVFFCLLGLTLFPTGALFGLYLLYYRLFVSPVAATSALFATFLFVSGLQALFFAMWFDMEYNQHLRVRFDSQQSNA